MLAPSPTASAAVMASRCLLVRTSAGAPADASSRTVRNCNDPPGSGGSSVAAKGRQLSPSCSPPWSPRRSRRSRRWRRPRWPPRPRRRSRRSPRSPRSRRLPRRPRRRRRPRRSPRSPRRRPLPRWPRRPRRSRRPRDGVAAAVSSACSSAATVSTISSIASAATASSVASASAMVSTTSTAASSRGSSLASLAAAASPRRSISSAAGRLELRLVGGDALDDLLDRLGRGASSTPRPRRRLRRRRRPRRAASSIARPRRRSRRSPRRPRRRQLPRPPRRGDGLDDLLDHLGGRGLLDDSLGGDLVTQLIHLGGGELLADLGERRGEGVVDAALRLLDRVRHRVATVGARPALGARRTGCARLGGRAGRRLLGLLEAQAEAMALGVERDDLELELLALVDDVGRMGDALVRQLADVDQALEPVADADERAEVHELRDRAVDDVAHLEVGDRGMPRVRLQATDRQADPATLVVDVDDLGLDLFADLVAGFGVVDLVPARARSCGRGRRCHRGR